MFGQTENLNEAIKELLCDHLPAFEDSDLLLQVFQVIFIKLFGVGEAGDELFVGDLVQLLCPDELQVFDVQFILSWLAHPIIIQTVFFSSSWISLILLPFFFSFW